MRKFFIINGLIEFSPQDSTLKSLRNGRVCRLFSPASRCLEYLLSNNTVLVSQSELFVAGWGNKEKNVTPNALYQNIMEIRRCMKHVGFNDLFLDTIPRSGWRVSEGVSIQVIVPQDESDGLTEPEAIPPQIYHSAKPSLSYSRKISGSTLTLIILSAFSIYALSYYFRLTTHHHNFFDGYNSIVIGDNCTLIIPPYFQSNKNIAMYEKYYLSRCDDHRQVYVTYDDKRVSVISCSQNKKTTNCFSDLYVQGD